MLDIGWSEMTVIVIVLLVVVGPSELPRLIKGIRSFVSGVSRVRSELRGHVDEMIREADLKEVLEGEKQAFGETVDAEKGAVTEHLSSLKDAVADLRGMQSELADVGRDVRKTGEVAQKTTQKSDDKGSGTL